MYTTDIQLIMQKNVEYSWCEKEKEKENITTQSVASPLTPHLSMITIVTFTFELWPLKLIGFTMINMSAKFNEEAHNGLVCIRFKAYFHMCPL